MNKPELYNRTVDILVQAYLNDTLMHGDCTACAVGNIVAANMGYEIHKDFSNRFLSVGFWLVKENDKRIIPRWREVFVTLDNWKQRIDKNSYEGETKLEIDSTGYSWRELAKIEYAFEVAPRGNSEDEWMFNGLMAVIEVLDKIHRNKDATVSQASKNRFNKEQNPETSVATEDAQRTEP